MQASSFTTNLSAKVLNTEQIDEVMESLNSLWKSQKMQVAQDPLESLYAKQSKRVESEDEDEDDEVEQETSAASPKKMVLDTEDLKNAVSKAGSALGVVVLVGVIIGYLSVFTQYKNALAKHDKLNTLLNHPNARVASGNQVQ